MLFFLLDFKTKKNEIDISEKRLKNSTQDQILSILHRREL
jgi:hypothetical protein